MTADQIKDLIKLIEDYKEKDFSDTVKERLNKIYEVYVYDLEKAYSHCLENRKILTLRRLNEIKNE